MGGHLIDCGPEQGPLIAHLQAAMQADAPRTRSQAKRWELLSTAGVALLGAAFVWHAASGPAKPSESPTTAALPWIGKSSGGLAFRSVF